MSGQEKRWQYDAKLMTRENGRHSVYDGDTVWLEIAKSEMIEIDWGFHVKTSDLKVFEYPLGSCRLYGIDTPEMRGDDKEAGRVSRDWLRERLEPHEWFQVETFKDAEDNFGRWLVTIYVEGVNINEEMVSLGLAKPYIP